MKRIEYERRRTLPGFPREVKCKTMKEVDAYLSGDKIQCLLCGRWFDNSGSSHLIRIHGVTADDYKKRCGIPWGRGLIGTICREKNVILMKKLIAEGKMNPNVKGKRSGFKRKLKSRPHPACVADGKRKWRREDYEAVLTRMREQQRGLHDVLKDPDLPSYATWRLYAKKHPELREKASRIQYTVPYPKWIRIRNAPPEFLQNCRRLRADGMSNKNIAKKLNVSMDSVKRVLRGFDKKMGITRRPKWDRMDFEAFLSRMREQQRRFRDVCQDPDLPGQDAWKIHVMKHPEFAAKLQEIHHRLPYPVQVVARKLSPRFRIDRERLSAAGMSMEGIAKSLGVSSKPVARVLRDFDKRFA